MVSLLFYFTLRVSVLCLSIRAPSKPLTYCECCSYKIVAKRLASFPNNILPLSTSTRDGNDGPWSTFFLGFGTPPQYTRVLISLNVVQPWPVLPQGCIPTDPVDCHLKRGSLFYTNESSTWQDQGNYTLEFEKNLGIDDNGDFGYDTLTLGLPGTGAPSVEKQIVAGIAAKDIYLGLWGVGARPTNLTSLNNPYPSLMTTLKEKGLVPSISYGYTAGAQYSEFLRSTISRRLQASS